MVDIIGLNAIFLVSIITLLLALWWPKVSKILFIALILRLIFLIINNYIFYLPDGDMDAISYESFAWYLVQDGLDNYSETFIGPHPYFISYIYANLYSLLGRSLLMLQSLSILFGIGLVFLGWLLAKKIWDDHTAGKVGWCLALYPTLASYSVLTMREVYISFFLALALFGIVCWTREKSYKSVFLIFFGFIGASYFHGASIIGLLVFLLFFTLDSLIIAFQSIKLKRINLRIFTFIIFSLIVFSLYFSNKISISYLGKFKDIINLSNIQTIGDKRMKGDAAYPEWTRINATYEIFYKAPARAVYFLFSPFPWDIKKNSHVIGLIDSCLIIGLSFLIFLNRKNIWRDPALRIILIILVCYFFVFGIGVSNFGSGIRHRSKFIFGLILLAGPFLPKFFYQKNKLMKILTKLSILKKFR